MSFITLQLGCVTFLLINMGYEKCALSIYLLGVILSGYDIMKQEKYH